MTEIDVVDAIVDVLIANKANARGINWSWPDGDTGTKFEVGSHWISVRRDRSDGRLCLEVKQVIGSKAYTLFNFPLGPGVYAQQVKVVLSGILVMADMIYTPVESEGRI